MRIDIITVLPEMLEGFVHESILARAEKKDLPRYGYTTYVTIHSTNGDVLMIIRMEAQQAW